MKKSMFNVILLFGLCIVVISLWFGYEIFFQKNRYLAQRHKQHIMMIFH